jgi:transcriptional regulator with XRE-family HTH domain
MNKLKTFREKHKITQIELAKVLNTSQRQISLYENHKRKLNEEQIETLIKVYHAEIGDLLELGTMEEKRNTTK